MKNVKKITTVMVMSVALSGLVSCSTDSANEELVEGESFVIEDTSVSSKLNRQEIREASESELTSFFANSSNRSNHFAPGVFFETLGVSRHLVNLPDLFLKQNKKRKKRRGTFEIPTDATVAMPVNVFNVSLKHTYKVSYEHPASTFSIDNLEKRSLILAPRGEGQIQISPKAKKVVIEIVE